MFSGKYKTQIQELSKENNLLEKQIEFLNKENEELKNKLLLFENSKKSNLLKDEKLLVCEEMIKGNEHNMSEIAFNANSNITDLKLIVEQNREVKNEIEELRRTFGSFLKEIENVLTSAENSKQNIEQLNDSVENISNVIPLIKDISDPTNFFALNVVIEAARAREAGRGFFVVADEVRKLAERTQKATLEVEGSISVLKQNSSSMIGESDVLDEIISRMESHMSSFKTGFDKLYEIDIATFHKFENLTNDLVSLQQKLNNFVYKIQNYKSKLLGDSTEVKDVGVNSFREWYNNMGKDMFGKTQAYGEIKASQTNFENDMRKGMSSTMKNSLQDFKDAEAETITMYQHLDNMAIQSKK